MRHSQPINDRNTNSNKKVGHFTDRDHFCTVTNHSKNSKKPQGKSHGKIHIIEQKHEQKYRYTESHKGKIVVGSFAFKKIEKMDKG